MKITTKTEPPERDYTFCGQLLQEVTSHPYLGVEIDNKLRWNNHYQKLKAKASKVLGFLKRNLWFCPQSIKVTAYNTLVRPVLEYACCSWDPFRRGDVSMIEAVQRKAARFCLNDYKQLSSVTQMLEDLKWTSLEDRRKEARLKLMHKIMNGDVGIKPEPYFKIVGSSRTTRGNSLRIQKDLIKKDIHKHSFFSQNGSRLEQTQRSHSDGRNQRELQPQSPKTTNWNKGR